MNPDEWFQLANSIALAGWLTLALSPLAARLLHVLGGTVIPLVLSVGYAAIVLAHWAGGQGGFDSLRSVEQLFQNRWLLLAGWVHYLAFDLLLGAWQVRVARREGIAHLALIPCLLATFLFGPAGHVLFQSLRVSHRVSKGRLADERGILANAHRALARLAEDSHRYTGLAVLLGAAMIPLLGALTLDTRMFQGINVWIKPLKFHVALVVYLFTLAVFSRFAQAEITRRPWWQWHERVVVLAVVLEVVWIGAAAALATASHFNEAPYWAAMYSAMGMAAVVLTSASTSLAWAIHQHPAGNLSPAVRIGLGDGGDLRAPHFFATHALQIVPLAGLVCARLFGRDARTPVHIVAFAYIGWVAATFIQALIGMPFLAGMLSA